MSKVYKNTKRPTGSQSEIPSVKCALDQCIVSGYQKFTITNRMVTPRSYSEKFNYIKAFLASKASQCNTVADIGASTGIVCFIAAILGYEKCYALDHDMDCLEVIKKIKNHLHISRVIEKSYSFGNVIEPVDIVIACALIHWVYSCTALYGDFDKIIKYLRKYTKKILIIEWINPDDVAIKVFHHINFNTDVIKEQYTRENFLKTLYKYFTTVEKGYSVRTTREIFICSV